MPPLERLAVWRMGLDAKLGKGGRLKELRAKTSWRASEVSKTMAVSGAMLGLFAQAVGLALVIKLASKAGKDPQQGLGAKASARQCAVGQAMMSAIDKISSMDWKGWRVGALSRDAKPGASEAVAFDLYAAMAAQALAHAVFQGKQAQLELTPALAAWRRRMEAKESLDGRAFERLLEAMEAAGVSATYAPFPELPTLGAMALTAHIGMNRGALDARSRLFREHQNPTPGG